MRFLVTGLDEPGERRRLEGLLRQCGGAVVDAIPPVDVRILRHGLLHAPASVWVNRLVSVECSYLYVSASRGVHCQMALHAPNHGLCTQESPEYTASRKVILLPLGQQILLASACMA